MISLTSVSKIYGPFRAVDDVSFEINRGEVVGFIGPNGAGKSTTMRMITGFLPPTSGKINVAGVDVLSTPRAAQAKIGYLPESAATYGELEVSEFLEFMGGMRGLSGLYLQDRLRTVIRLCQLGPALGKSIQTLSKGFRQRTCLAQALLHDPEILILDEPTVGLDPNQIIDFRSVLKEIGANKTVLLSTHILSEVEATCQRIIMIHNGRIVAQGSLPELLTAHECPTLEAVFIKLTRGAAPAAEVTP